MAQSSVNLRQMKSLIEKEKRELQKLLEEEKQLRQKYISTTSDLERNKIEKRLRILILPQIARKKQSILSKTHMTNALEKKFKNLKTLQNRQEKNKTLRAATTMTTSSAVKSTPSWYSGMFTRKAPPTTTTATTSSSSARVNHLSPSRRASLNKFEAELMASPEWKKMEQNNAQKEKVKLNMRKAKNEEQRKYYELMLKALEDEANQNTTLSNLNSMLSRLEKPFTAEEEAELQAEFNRLPDNADGTGAGSSTRDPIVNELQRRLNALKSTRKGGKRSSRSGKSRKASRRRLTRKRR